MRPHPSPVSGVRLLGHWGRGTDLVDKGEEAFEGEVIQGGAPSIHADDDGGGAGRVEEHPGNRAIRQSLDGAAGDDEVGPQARQGRVEVVWLDDDHLDARSKFLKCAGHYLAVGTRLGGHQNPGVARPIHPLPPIRFPPRERYPSPIYPSSPGMIVAVCWSESRGVARRRHPTNRGISISSNRLDAGSPAFGKGSLVLSMEADRCGSNQCDVAVTQSMSIGNNACLCHASGG